MKRHIIIAHRWSGSPTSDWYPWLKEKLEQEGYAVHVPKMGDTEEPTIREWVGSVKRTAQPLALSKTIFVGHSIGVQAILRFLAEQKEKEVDGLVTVAGWFHLENLEDEEAEEAARPWLETPIATDRIKSSVKKTASFFSSNDPYVPEKDHQIFQEKLGAEVHVLERAGHFTEDDGYTTFPQVLSAVRSIAE